MSHRALAVAGALSAIVTATAHARADDAPSDRRAPASRPADGASPGRATAAQAPREGSAAPRISLAEAIRRAAARNVTVTVAAEEIQRAEALVREARATSLPTLTANGIYTRLDSDRVFQGRVVAAQNQISANLVLSVPLVVPQRWAQWSHASSNAQTARASAEDVRRQVAIAVARTYLAVISQKRVIDVGERALATAKAHFDYAHTRLTGGIGNRIDAVRAEQEMATDETRVEAGYAALARSREALGILAGEQGPLDTEDDVVLAASPEFDGAMREATTQRRDVIAARTRLAAAEQVRRDSYTDYLPFLIGNVQPFYQNPPTLVQPLTGWQAQILLTIPIYDGGLRYGLLAEREALSNEARSQYEALIRQARSDVRLAFESVKRAEAALVSATNAARLARSALELATMAYQAGATTNIEVIDAERRARDAETAAAVAEDGARQARVDLLAATGRFP
jgi:outer membrane protein TolC